MSNIHSIVYSPGRSKEKEQPYRYNRVPAEQVELIAGHGIQGDFKAGRHPKRHINIMTREILDELAEAGYKTGPGEMGEQVVVSGLDVVALDEGALLQLGESAVIRLNEPRTGCDWLEKVQGRETRHTAKNRLGMMATVIESGTVKVGDEVRVMVEQV